MQLHSIHQSNDEVQHMHQQKAIHLLKLGKLVCFLLCSWND